MTLFSSLFFDANDHELLQIIRDVQQRSGHRTSLRALIFAAMHPHGIKELAAAKGLRIAYASACLLGSLETGLASDRLTALRSLRDEVLLASTSYFQKNTARVLLQIMKELLRNGQSEQKQLELAHDFRMVSTGQARLVRQQLSKYRLLEMPEEWNQLSFDHRVHDANTKGRKSATHLIMDAWIKGIRSLTVVYYNFVDGKVAAELLEAAEILKIKVQIGIEMAAPLHGHYVRFTWLPRGFTSSQAFLGFLGEQSVADLFAKSRLVSDYQSDHVLALLQAYNSRHRLILANELSCFLPEISQTRFFEQVGTGQPSLLHLAIAIRSSLTAALTAADTSPNQAVAAVPSAAVLIERFLLPDSNPQLPDISRPDGDGQRPELLRLAPAELLARLHSVHASSQFTLNLSNLSAQDVLELLYSCQGLISHVEISFSTSQGRPQSAKPAAIQEKDATLIGELQEALNADNIILLKRAIRAIIWDFDNQPPEAGNEETVDLAAHTARKEYFLDILNHLQEFHDYYQKRPLVAALGSGSTGQATQSMGMGFAVRETLPPHALRQLRADGEQRRVLPISASITRHRHSRMANNDEPASGQRLSDHFPFFRRIHHWHDWTLDALRRHPGQAGNVLTLGGGQPGAATSGTAASGGNSQRRCWPYLQTNLKNSLKVAGGFLPAFVTFYLTKDWWLLAYFGAVIWFTITFIRNLLQSVVGGGGLRRSPLLPWNSLVSWSRIADSLFYTGFSVPLLDFLVKSLLLDQLCGITTATNPVLLYAVMGLVNGLYICGHNLFRGLPRSAAAANLFRSLFAIPLAVAINAALAAVLPGFGVTAVSDQLQKWAAIISKLASDSVAAIIEGLADRQSNIRQRRRDYHLKISQLFSAFARLDVLLPQQDVLELLQSPKQIIATISKEARDLEHAIIVNALDLMYFWYYQPRAQAAFVQMVRGMSREEWLIIYRLQLVLSRFKTVSKLYVDGHLVGKKFTRALTFYLNNWEGYLIEMARIDQQHQHNRTAAHS